MLMSSLSPYYMVCGNKKIFGFYYALIIAALIPIVFTILFWKYASYDAMLTITAGIILTVTMYSFLFLCLKLTSSQQKISAETLKKSEELNELVIRGLSAGIWDFDIIGKRIYFSEKLRDILKWRNRGITITFDEFIDSIHEEDRENFIRCMDAHLTKRKAHDLEFRILNGDGEYIWVHMCGHAVWNDNGDATRMVGSITDISERKLAEEELIRSNMDLERFAYIASHDLQEPVRMIRNFSKLLTDEYGNDLNGDAREYLGFINRGATNIQNMIEDLLTYSLVGKTDVVVEDVDVTLILNNLIETLKPTMNECGAVVTYDAMPVLSGNSVSFARLFQNLIGNGIKYRRAGVPPNIHVMVEDIGDMWMFSVSDNGIGIKEEYLDKIFIIFKRLHNKNEYQGTGIGLAICKKIVDGMGGKIWAESKYGEGTDFHFTVPKNLSQKFTDTDEN